jgi:asparagine synthase (glutamine-hydrolysing)
MCGICGVFQVDGTPRQVLAPDFLDRMTDAMTHRGPDDRGTYAADGVALGARRLSIVDVKGGHQPVSSEDGSVWAVQNGELYNHGQLRDGLRNRQHLFGSRCDTEVLPHLYEEHGAAFPQHLRGKFAIAVWDGLRRRGVLARDRLGVKPLYYAHVGGLVVFGSELKSVLASGLVEARIDVNALDAYLTFGFTPGPSTLLAGVRKLQPGHRLVVSDGDVRVERYWNYPTPSVERPRLARTEYAELLLAELEESVRLRLMSDVPLGAMLSGGLDSTLVVALMARNMSEPVKTFSVGFVEDGEGNELADARFVSEVFGTDHHELKLSYTRDTVDLAELVWHLDEPMADLSALGFDAISQLAARHVTVALSGQGADELLGGYRKHQAATFVAAWKRLGRPGRALANVAARGPSAVRRPARTLAARTPAERLVAMSGRVDADLRRSLFRGPLADLDGKEGLRAVEALAAGIDDDPLPATLFVDCQLALVDDMLHYFDRTSMAHSLEVRVPFLDHHVVELCARIPGSEKVRRLRTKALLKDAARGIIPDRIIDKKKLGFLRSASDGWFRAQIDGAVSDYLLVSSTRCSEFLDQPTLERMVAGHARSGRSTDIHLLLAILMLEIWLSTYLPRAVSPPSATRERVTLSQ